MTWTVFEAGRKTVGHGETVQSFQVRRHGVPGVIEVSMYESDTGALALAMRVAEALNLLDRTNAG